MQHLDLERLAAFDDTLFTDVEQAHLASCSTCRRELAAMASLVVRATSLRTADPVVPAREPLVSFEQITHALQQDAVPAHGSRGTRAVSLGIFARRAAAAMILVASGALLGRMTVSSRPTDARVVDGSEAPLNTATATAMLDRAQQEYERASLWLAANDSTSQSSDVYRARLAALDQMMAASRAALREAPQDPLLNHYYLSAWTAREATLQQLGAVLPVDKQVERY